MLRRAKRGEVNMKVADKAVAKVSKAVHNLHTIIRITRHVKHAHIVKAVAHTKTLVAWRHHEMRQARNRAHDFVKSAKHEAKRSAL